MASNDNGTQTSGDSNEIGKSAEKLSHLILSLGLWCLITALFPAFCTVQAALFIVLVLAMLGASYGSDKWISGLRPLRRGMVGMVSSTGVGAAVVELTIKKTPPDLVASVSAGEPLPGVVWLYLLLSIVSCTQAALTLHLVCLQQEEPASIFLRKVFRHV
ncbi:hypothetical protein GCM10027396_27880 [Insolitispirillum peregrinum]|uniref:hypothetical protein n=1 Tax=Insolitispirillum peregrinum TaxID=80876 RepID=UPI0036D2A29E